MESHPDPIEEFFTCLETAKLSGLNRLYVSEILPRIHALDPSVVSLSFFSRLIDATLLKYATFSKPLQNVPLSILRQCLNSAKQGSSPPVKDSKHIKMVAGCITKYIQQALILPCAQTKAHSSFPVPCHALVYGLAWLDTLLVCFDDSSLPMKLFAMHCTLLGLILHHSQPPKKPRAFTKFALSLCPSRKALAALWSRWILEEKLKSDVFELHGALATLVYIVKQGWVPPEMLLISDLFIKYIATSKLPVPKPVLQLLQPLFSEMEHINLFAASEKMLLHSPEVVLPVLFHYFSRCTMRNVTLTAAFLKNFTQQFASANAEIAQYVFQTFLLAFPLLTEQSQVQLVNASLSVVPKCATPPQKALIFKALEHVVLPFSVYTQLIKSVKTESNDNLALLTLQTLWSKAGTSNPELTESLLMEAWPRVNEKIRKNVLESVYDSGRVIPMEKVKACQEPVALALLLKNNAFDPVADKHKLTQLVTTKLIDAYYVYALNQVCQWKARSPLLTSAQLETCFKSIFHTNLVHLLEPMAVMEASDALFAALQAYVSHLPEYPTFTQRKHFKSILTHLNSSETLLSFFLLAHHPVLPEGFWSDLAFLSNVSLETWVKMHRTDCVKMIQEACISDIAWKRTAALRAAASLVWIFDAYLIDFVKVANDLIENGKSIQREAALVEASPTMKKGKPIPCPTNASAKKDTRPISSKNPSAHKKEASQRTSLISSNTAKLTAASLSAEMFIAQGLALIRSILLPEKNFEPVIQSILSLLSSTQHPDVQKTWSRLQVFLDDRMVKMGPLLFSLLGPEASYSAAHEDEMVSSILFQVLCLCRSDFELTPVSFVILHALLRKVYLSALARMSSADKVVLNRILDHITFMVEIISHHSSLAFSTLIPIQELLEELFTMMKFWNKQAPMMHEAIVALCHARKEFTSGELTMLKEACVSGNELVAAAALESSLYLTSPFPKEFQIAVLSLTYHPVFDTIAKSLVDRHQFSSSLHDLELYLDLCMYTPLATSCCQHLESLLQAHDLKIAQSSVQDFYPVILKRYQASLHVPKKFDEFGLEVEQDVDNVTPRLGVLEFFAAVAPFLPSNPKVLKTWIPFVEDSCTDIQTGLLRALQIYVSKNEDKEFIQILKSFSAHKSDDIRMSVSILMGAFACHLAPEDKLNAEILNALLEALRTPSEKVQIAVSKCLALFSSKVLDSLLKKLAQTLFKEKHYGAQRGCAYAIAEIFKAQRGLMRSFNVADVLKKNLNSKNVAARQGALLLAECCTLVLGRKFEPFLVLSAPYFLELCADTNNTIRQATLDATQVMMSFLSSHAAILLMPVLLEGLKSDAWRTKKASVEMIAIMTKGAPAQLGSALPMLIQAILEASVDSHSQVSTAATEALKSLSHMIQVPELMDLASLFVDALLDPKKSTKLLQMFTATTLEHYLDAPSLALLVPNLSIGLDSRQPELKFLAAQILLSLTKVVKRQQLLAYVDTLVALLRRALSDAVDKNRSVASRALGHLVKSLGSPSFPTLVHDLLQVLNQSTSTFDKSGAAQALSEVFAALGADELKKWMSTILRGLKSDKRDGYLVLLVFLPMTFQNGFAPFLGDTLPCVLAGLADELPMIRDTAKRAANVVIERFSVSAVDLLLSELLKCLFHPVDSVRQSSVELLGDLLSELMGKSKFSSDLQASNLEFIYTTSDNEKEGFMDDGEEDGKEEAAVSMTRTQKLKTLTDTIGHAMYRQTLASIYLLRYDPAIGVRHASMTIWRKIVYNTPRQLKEILPNLLHLILQYLNKEKVLPLSNSVTRVRGNGNGEKTSEKTSQRAEENDAGTRTDEFDLDFSEEEGELGEEEVEASESFTMATSTLDDVVRKLGDSIFELLLPLLSSHLSTHTKGVCLSISVLIPLCPNTLPDDMMKTFSNCISFALRHSNKIIREAGTLAYLELLSHSGAMCVDIVLAPMLSQLPSSLPGLEMVMQRRGHIVLPVLLPTFLDQLSDPVSLQTLQRLLVVSSMKGSAVQMLRMLLDQYSETIVPIIKCLLSHSFHGSTLDQIMEVLEDFRQENLGAVCSCISALVGQAPTHLKQTWLEWLISVLNTDNPSDIEALFQGVDILVKSIAKEDLDVFVNIVATGLSKYKSNPNALQHYPRGPAPLLQIVLHTLMYGTLKEQALRALIQIIELTPEPNLKAHIVSITGPLIRILGDRVNTFVKALALESVASLLKKVGLLLKPFLPQLSRALLRQLETEDPQCLQVTQDCLIQLIPLHPRPDTLIQELSLLFKTSAHLNSLSISTEQVVAHVLKTRMSYVQDPDAIKNVISISLSHESNLSAELIAKYVSRFPKEGWISLTPAKSSFLARIYYFYLEAQVLSIAASGPSPDSTAAIPKQKEIVQFLVQGLKDTNEVVSAFSALSGQFLFCKSAKVYQSMCSTLESASYILKRCLLHSFASQASKLEMNDISPLIEALIKLLKARSPLKGFADQCLFSALRLNIDDEFYRAYCDSNFLPMEDIAFLKDYYKRSLKAAAFPPLSTNDELVISISGSTHES